MKYNTMFKMAKQEDGMICFGLLSTSLIRDTDSDTLKIQ